MIKKILKLESEDQANEIELPLLKNPNDLDFLIAENSIVTLTEEITPSNSLKFIDKLYYAAAINEGPIIILINCPGGDAYSTIGITEAIRSLDKPSIGLCQGLAASGGFYAFEACTHRVMFKNSLLFWHEMIRFEENLVIKSADEMQKYLSDYKKLNEHILNSFRKHRGITKTNWDQLFKGKNDLLFNASESIKYKLADESILKISQLKKFFKQPKVTK